MEQLIKLQVILSFRKMKPEFIRRHRVKQIILQQKMDSELHTKEKTIAHLKRVNYCLKMNLEFIQKPQQVIVLLHIVMPLPHIPQELLLNRELQLEDSKLHFQIILFVELLPMQMMQLQRLQHILTQHHSQ